MLDAKDFQRISIAGKVKLLQKDATYVTKRYFLKFEVELYTYNGYFVEIFRTLSFGEIFSIDVAPDRSVKEAYLKSIDLKALGLSDN